MSCNGKEERVCVELTAVQHQQNGREDPQSLPTTSSNNTSSETQQNLKTSSRHLAAVNVSERAKTYLYNHRQHLEIALLAVVIIVVLILLLLPTVFYLLPQQSVSTFAITTWERNPCSFKASDIRNHCMHCLVSRGQTLPGGRVWPRETMHGRGSSLTVTLGCLKWTLRFKHLTFK